MASDRATEAVREAQPEGYFRTESGWAFYTERAAEVADRLLAEERERCVAWVREAWRNGSIEEEVAAALGGAILSDSAAPSRARSPEFPTENCARCPDYEPGGECGGCYLVDSAALPPVEEAEPRPTAVGPTDAPCSGVMPRVASPRTRSRTTTAAAPTSLGWPRGTRPMDELRRPPTKALNPPTDIDAAKEARKASQVQEGPMSELEDALVGQWITDHGEDLVTMGMSEGASLFLAWLLRSSDRSALKAALIEAGVIEQPKDRDYPEMVLWLMDFPSGPRDAEWQYPEIDSTEPEFPGYMEALYRFLPTEGDA